MRAEIAFAASAGMLAAFNPCGFALLPGYLVMFLGGRGSKDAAPRRALLVGGALTVGFVAVFGTLGAAFAILSISLGPWLSVVTLLAGLLLLTMGLMLLSGRDVTLRMPRARLLVNGSVPGMVAYGIIYATVSLSCTLPVFMAAVVAVFAAPGAAAATGSLAGVAYAGGMGLVMVTLTVIVGLLGRGSLVRARGWTRHVGRASGLVVVLAALYVLWYAWVERQSYAGQQVGPGVVAWVSAASGRVGQVVADAGTGRTVLVLTALLTAAIAATLGASRKHRRSL
jgi:cytochrome c-type biogenesis protein